ncbi:MAG: hypothetical protein ACM3YN_07950 [Parcubacteria group bacterium]
MRVDASLSALTPSAVPTTSPAQGDLAPSFEQVLQEGVALEVQRQERAFGFSELGVIRPSPPGATPQAEPMTAKNPVDAASEDAETLMRAGESEPSKSAALRTSSPAPETRSAAPTGKTFMEMSAVRPQATAESPQAVVAFPQAPSLRPARPSQNCVPKAPARQLPQEGQPKRFSLVVSEQDGAVQIIAGTPRLSEEAKERLRRAAAMLAAEFGVTLGDLTLNGALIDAPAPTTGAPDGHFPG